LKILENLKEIDLFKADIYSLGITFFRVVTGLNVFGINESRSKE